MRGRDGGLVQRIGDAGELILQSRAHEVVAVVHHQRDARLILLIDPPRILRRNNDCALNLAIAHVVHCRLLVVIIDGLEGAHVGADGIEGLADLQRLRASVLIDQAESGVANLSAKCIAQHDELHQRENHRRHHQRRRAEKLAHLAFDNRQHAVHGCIPGRGGMTKRKPSPVRRATGARCSGRTRRRARCFAPRAI